MLHDFARRVVPKPIWNRMRLWKQRRHVARYPKRRVRHCYGGHFLEIELSDGLAEGWYDKDWPELAEIGLLRKHRLRPGACVFDLGAHQSVVALMLAKEVGPTGRVVSVEANRHNASAGETNKRLNQAEQLTVLHAAAADRPGTVVFGEGLNGQIAELSDDWGRVEVQAVTIDELAERYGMPDVLFIDVEGFECRVLRGGPKALSGRPDCFIEVHVGMGLEKFGGSFQEILSYFDPADYEFWISDQDGGGFVPYSAESPLLRERFFFLALGRGN